MQEANSKGHKIYTPRFGNFYVLYFGYTKWELREKCGFAIGTERMCVSWYYIVIRQKCFTISYFQ